MSEHEMQRREEYKRNRKKWTLIQIIAIAVLAVLALSMFALYSRMNQTYYIEYTEKSNIDYKVQYKETPFFEEEWIEKDQAYISSLVNSIIADFNYRMDMGTSNISFDYKYQINANLLITDKSTGNVYYTVQENLLPEKSGVAKKTSTLRIGESVAIDYVKFNEIATSFTDIYDLKSATCALVVTLDVEVLSSAEQFEEGNQNRYSTSLNIPLDEDTFSIHTSSSVPQSESRVIAYKGAEGSIVFHVCGIICAILSALGVVALLIFLHLTKNEDITYEAKISKLLRAYGSYITRIEGEFDCEGYQLVAIKSFTEMLGVRDTIQRPILMSENKDATMTRFLIPTNTQVLYLFEIKVDNYDEIYAPKEEPVEEVAEESVILESVDEQMLAEAMAQPDVDLSQVEFDPDDDDEFEVAENQPGVEVIGVVWPERAKHNKVYRYDPNGEVLEEGDIVLVPTRDAAKGQDVLRKVAVAHANHRVDPEHIKHPLKKIVAIIKRSTVRALTPLANQSEEQKEQ